MVNGLVLLSLQDLGCSSSRWAWEDGGEGHTLKESLPLAGCDLASFTIAAAYILSLQNGQCIGPMIVSRSIRGDEAWWGASGNGGVPRKVFHCEFEYDLLDPTCRVLKNDCCPWVRWKEGVILNSRPEFSGP